jgi:hypothetical protein
MSTDVSEVRALSITTLMMEAASTSETFVDIQLRTQQYVPEDCELHTRRLENLKSHIHMDAIPVSYSEKKNLVRILLDSE